MVVDAEHLRQAELDSYGIIDTPPEARFDRVIQLAARILDMPIALISLTDKDRQWFKAKHGVDRNETPRRSAFSSIIDGAEILEVRDAMRDERFATNPLVTGAPNIRFYAGAPLISAGGFKLGALCVMDTRPRRLTDDQRVVLTDLAHMVMDEFELHRHLRNEQKAKRHDKLKALQLRRILDCVTLFIAVLTPEGKIVDVNRTPIEEAGMSALDVIDQPLWQTFWWGDRTDSHQALQTAIKNAANGETVRLDIGMRVRSDQHIITETTCTPLLNDRGKTEYIVVSANNITDRKAMEYELRHSEQLFRATFENAAVGMALVSLDSRWLSVNERLLSILGYTEQEMLAKTLPEVAHPDDVPGHLHQFGLLKSGAIDRYSREKRYLKKDGSPIWVHVTVSLQRSENGTPQYGIMVIEDIEERKRHEERQKLLLGELSHRTKNIMAMMQAIANNSLRYSRDPKRFVDTFRGRLQAMAAAHDLLTQENWQRADLREIVRSQLYVEARNDQNRIELHGPSLLLSGQVAISLALILHELASNAVKYGALSVPSGAVTVSWDLTRKNDVPFLTIEWVETGGPSSAEPAEQGFGMHLIDRLLKRALGAEVNFDWRGSGMAATIELPLPQMRENQLFRL